MADPFRWSDEKVARSLGTEFHLERAAFDGARVLDVSEGTSMANALREAEAAVYLHPRAAAVADRADAAAFVGGTPAALPFPDDTFDAAVAIGTFAQARDPGAAARELGRVLRPDGVLLCEADAFALPARVRARLTDVDSAHRQHFSPESLVSLLESSGFAVERRTVEKDDVSLGTPPKVAVATLAFRLRRTYLRARAEA